MAYVVNLKASAEKQLDNLPSEVQNRVIKRLILLKENPRSYGVKKLQGFNGYRVRIGDYRILYTIDDLHKIIEIVSIALWRDAYR